MKFVMTGALFFLPLAAVNAQQLSGTNQLDSVIVRENRLQASLLTQDRNLTILNSEQIALLPVKSAAELLSYVAGVDLRQRGPWGSQADISIDGSTFDEVLVLINGVKMSDPQTGHHMLNLPVPLESIDHIEVLRGAAARVYGVNALAGAVNIITKIPLHNELSAQLYASGNFKTDTSNGESFYGWGARASGALALKDQAHMFSVAHDQANGYRYNTSSDAYRLFYQNKIKINSRNTLEAAGGYTSNEFGAGLFYAAPYDNEAKETVQTALAGIKNTIRLSDKISLMPALSYRYNKDDYIYIRQKPEVYHNIHETAVVTGELQTNIHLTEKAVLGAGAELRNEQIHSNNLGRHERNNLGIYAEAKYHFTSNLDAGAGAYGNYNSDYGWQLFPGVDAGFRFAGDWKAYVNASTGQRLPTYTDLYYNGPSNIGNADLKPETAAYAEGGLQYRRSLWSAQGSYFSRHTSNFIDWVKQELADKWQPRNFQTVDTRGITLQANCDLARAIHLFSHFTIGLQASYTYLDASIDAPSDKISKYTIDALRHQLIASVHASLYSRLQFELNGRYQQRISMNDYTLLDSRVALLFPRWKVSFDVNNILDTQYKELGAVPLPGRWYTLGIGFDIPGQ